MASKRKQFSLEEKKSIISEVDKGMKKVDVAKKYGISPSTLSTFLKDRGNIFNQLQTSVLGPLRKRMRKAQFEDVDVAVFRWFLYIRSLNVPLTGPLIREKALEFAQMLGVEKFQASVGWLNRFRDRYAVVSKYISGEASYTPLQSFNEWRKAEVSALIKKYSPNDVFNANEAGVFFQLEPREALALKGDLCVGDEVSKQRVTALFCCNQSGTEKRKVLIIGKSANPRCLKNCKSLPCIYRSNEKAWMTQAIFNDWLVDFDREMNEKGRKILLFIDSCTPHNNPPKLENICVQFFLPNCMTRLQPLDQGIIRAVKSRYRTFLLRQILWDLEKNLQRKCNIKEAIDWICGSWDDISQSTIINCWKYANIDGNSVLNDAHLDEESYTDDIQQSELEKIWNAAKEKTLVPDDVNLEDYLGADDNVSTCYELAEAEITQSIEDSKDEADESSEDEVAVVGDIPHTVTSSEALASLETVRTFITSQSNVPEFIFTNIHHLQNYLLSNATANLVQEKIVDYPK